MYRTDDPIRDFNQYDAEQAAELERIPRCCYCGEHLQQEEAVNIDDNWYCDECLDDHFRKRVADHVY